MFFLSSFVFNPISSSSFLGFSYIVFQINDFCSFHCFFSREQFIEIKYLSKPVVRVILKNISIILTKENQNLKIVIAQEDWNVTMIKKDKISNFQILKVYIMKKVGVKNLRKQTKIYLQFKDLVGLSVEIENRVKALEQKVS